MGNAPSHKLRPLMPTSPLPQWCKLTLRRRHEALVSLDWPSDDSSAKLTLNQGPACGRPMPLILPTEGNIRSHNLPINDGKKGNQQQQHRVDGAAKHTRVKLERSELFDCVYICCHVSTRCLTKKLSVVFLSWPWRRQSSPCTSRQCLSHS